MSLIIPAAEKQLIGRQKAEDDAEHFHKQVRKPYTDENAHAGKEQCKSCHPLHKTAPFHAEPLICSLCAHSLPYAKNRRENSY